MLSWEIWVCISSTPTSYVQASFARRSALQKERERLAQELERAQQDTARREEEHQRIAAELEARAPPRGVRVPVAPWDGSGEPQLCARIL